MVVEPSLAPFEPVPTMKTNNGSLPPASLPGGNRTIEGKTCLITGATNGIGRVTAVELARMGAELFLTYRDEARANETVAEIRKESGNEKVHPLHADLGSQKQIRGVAAEFLAMGRPLHVLINNAGLGNTKRMMTEDGIEMVFAVNHLAYFLLTILLLERIKQSAPARIVNVASEGHRFGTINFDDLGGERHYRTFGAYGHSKLANILFSYELARRLAGTGVTVNCLHPGGIASGLWTNNRAACSVHHEGRNAFS